MTVEEGVLAGGFGSAVWETLNDAGLHAAILRVGLPDRYVTHGKPALLHEEVGFTGERIAARVAAAIDDRGRTRRVQASSPGGAGSGSASAGCDRGRLSALHGGRRAPRRASMGIALEPPSGAAASMVAHASSIVTTSVAALSGELSHASSPLFASSSALVAGCASSVSLTRPMRSPLLPLEEPVNGITPAWCSCAIAASSSARACWSGASNSSAPACRSSAGARRW